MLKTVFSLLLGLLSAAFFAGTARYFGLDEWVLQMWRSLTSSSQLGAVCLMVGGLAGIVVLICSLVFHWEKKLSDLWHGRYARDAIQDLRRSVEKVREEWMKFPAGPSEDARYRILREFLTITDDYAKDSKLGPLVRQMQSDAMRMAMISSLSYPQTFSLTEQQERLADLNSSLQNAALQLLAATRRYALFD